MADRLDVMDVMTRDHLTLSAERAIRDREDGTMHLEWTNVPHAALVDVITKSQTPEKYEIMVRYVTEWQVEE